MDREAILQRWQANTVLIDKRWLLLQFHANTITARRVVREIGLARSAIANAEYEARMARWEEGMREAKEKGILLERGGLPPLDRPVKSRSVKSDSNLFGENARQNTREMSIDDWISGRG